MPSRDWTRHQCEASRKREGHRCSNIGALQASQGNAPERSQPVFIAYCLRPRQVRCGRIPLLTQQQGKSNMTTVHATPIIAVLGSMAAPDGQHAFVRLQMPDKSEPVLAMPASELFRMIEALAVSAAQIQKITGATGTPVYHSTWFEVGENPANGDVVLNLTLASGGRLAFAMARSMAEQLREVLDVHLGGKNPRSPETPLQ